MVAYRKILDWLYGQLPNYQKQGSKAYKPDLTNIEKICAHLGNPHIRFPVVHIAGTNGKGSTAHMLSAVLQASGFRVGLYTSPHLLDFRERIKIDGKCVSKQYVIDFAEQHRDFFEQIQASFLR